MPKGIFNVPLAVNEPVRSYEPGSDERKSLQQTYDQMWESIMDVPMEIGGKKVKTKNKQAIHPPHDHQHTVGYFYDGGTSHAEDAIKAALEARPAWAAMPWEHRASIFLKAAELIAGPYRDRLNAATMIGQGKNAFQAEIDSACEIIDFLRFNVQFMSEIYADQPISDDGIWNRVEYRALEGFLYAVTPFNFTAIAGNLPSCMAMMGNVVVWKPSDKQMLSAGVLMEIFNEAGVPAGVINMIQGDAAAITKVCFDHPDFAGVHFTGSTGVFRRFWTQIGANIDTYKTYPRIVGETGGKDFVWAHSSANAKAVATALIRGAFEYQGQKCSAASRAYIPESMWEEVRGYMQADLDSIKMGSPRDFTNFVNAVISRDSFDKIAGYIDRAKKSKKSEVIFGGNYDDSKGYFIEPTVILAKDAEYESMCEEIFGPVLTVYVYDDKNWESVLDTVNSTSPYALTGAIFAQDRYVMNTAAQKLVDAAGNFYINDKPTGAVVGQQPFGGARASGTNDKAGSSQNLLRWVSPRLIKETFVSSKDYRYPFLGQDEI